MLVSKDSLPDAIRRTTFEIVRQNMTEKGRYIDSLPGTGLVTFLALVKEKGIRPSARAGGISTSCSGTAPGRLRLRPGTSPKKLPHSLTATTS